MTQEELFKKYVQFYHLEDKYVILKEDENGQYIEYAYKEGAPHDNRCLSWYYSLQPGAIRRNNEAFGHPEEAEKEIEWRYKRIKEKYLGKIFELYSFTCGHEENMEKALEENKKSWEEFYPDQPFVAEDHMCRVGKPAPKCIKNCICAHWTYKEPVKCACWSLDLCDFRFSIPSKDIEEFSKFIYSDGNEV